MKSSFVRSAIRGMCLFLVFFFASGVQANEKRPVENVFDWQPVRTMPAWQEGAFTGSDSEALISAGGVERDSSGSITYLDSVCIQEKGRTECRSDFKLPRPMAYGSAVSTSRGMVLIGGSDGKTYVSDVLLLKWEEQKQSLSIETLPSLPEACAFSGAAVNGDTIYVVGGVESASSDIPIHTLRILDLSKSNPAWKTRAGMPEEAGRISPAVVIQSNGESDSLFVFGGELNARKDISNPGSNAASSWRYDFAEKEPSRRWKAVADSPVCFASGNAISIGQTHIMIFSKFCDEDPSGEPWDCLVYHTITDTWVKTKQLPENMTATAATVWKDTVAVQGNVFENGTESSSILCSKAEFKTKGFGTLNYLTLGGYLTLLVLAGILFSRKKQNTHDYFLAGKRMPWWAAGISIYGSTFSAISFMGSPAKAYATDWLYFLASVAMMPVILFAIYYFVPFVCRLQVTTAYEYLEKRFNVYVRLFGSLVFILFQLGRVAIMLLLPALALSAVTGISIWFCILTMGLLCIIYIVVGGIEAVIWNDCLQVLVMTASITALFFIVSSKVEGGFSSIFMIGEAHDKFRLANFTWDYTVASLWVVLVGNFLGNFAPYITDQSVIQRYLTTPNERMSKQALWFNFWFIVPNSVLFFMVGTALYVYYKAHPALLSPTIATDAIMPWFVVREIPAGLCGLAIAGIFAASMSSLDSSIHSVSTAIVTDFVRRFRRETPDAFYVKLARALAMLLGIFGTAEAMLMATFNIISLWDIFLMLLSLLGGGISGVFLLGILTRRANGPGVFIGALVSAGVVFFVQRYTAVHFFLYAGFGLVSAMAVGYVCSFFFRGSDYDVANLTIYKNGNKE